RLFGISVLKGVSLSAPSISKNPAKIRTFGSAIFCGADFWQDKTQNADEYFNEVLAEIRP
ncbi:MAG: hypothetical protein IKJ27_02670, partial [Clostridia bacterium]|nr:hypothetical protein [Clostridia bacterium]